MTHTILFDLDGTLLNTLDDLTDSVNYALALLRFPARTVEEVRSFVGNGVGALIHRALPPGAAAEQEAACLAAFREHYRTNLRTKTIPYPGILPLLEQLKARDTAVGVVSNKPDAAVKSLCGHFFPGLIGAAVGEGADAGRKPDPSGVFYALKQLGGTPEDALYVGDSEVDIQTARSAGIPCLCVTWGFRDQAFLAAQGAERFLSRPEDLLAL